MLTMLDEVIGGERYEVSPYYAERSAELFTKSGKPRKGAASLRWAELEHNPQGRFFQPTFLSFGDYDNSGTVERSNVRVFKEQFASLESREWWELHGGYGSTAIMLRNDADERHEELREFFEGLENYPIADESDWSEVEMEQEAENWRDYGEREFRDTVMGYVPEHLEERIETALEGKVYDLFRALNEATGSYPEQEATSTRFHEEEMVWRTLAKMNEAEWLAFLALLENANTKWDYGGNGFQFLRDLYDRKLTPDEIASLAWGYGLPQFRSSRDGLTSRFQEYWRGARYVPNPNPPPNLIQSPDLTAEQREHLERVYGNLQALSDEALTVLFWKLLRPAWDANHESYQHAYTHRWDRPPHFNFHWMNSQFAAHAFDTAFLVLLDALTEGSFDAVPQFLPVVTEWFRPAPR